jgi:hypothetical protein
MEPTPGKSFLPTKSFGDGGPVPLVFAKRRDMKGFPGSMPAGGHGAGEGFPKVFGMEASKL